MIVKEVEIKWLGHSSVKIKTPDGKIIYIDPYEIKENSDKADFILITHSHPDHCSIADIEKVIKQNSRVVISADCQSKITRIKTPLKIEVIELGNEMDFHSIKVLSVPAYNTDKSFHPKSEAWFGYVIKIGEVIIYHAGDTDFIPEMQKLTGYKRNGNEFIALLPIGGRFTMDVDEAVEAAKVIKPSLAVPIHYGAIIGSRNDAEEFVKQCKSQGINSKILE